MPACGKGLSGVKTRPQASVLQQQMLLASAAADARSTTGHPSNATVSKLPAPAVLDQPGLAIVVITNDLDCMESISAVALTWSCNITITRQQQQRHDGLTNGYMTGG